MKDILLMNVINSLTNVGDNFPYTFFRKMLVFVDECPEVSISHGFHHHVEVVFVAKHMI